MRYIFVFLLLPFYSNGQSTTHIDTLDVDGYYISKWEKYLGRPVESGFFYKSVFENNYQEIYKNGLVWSMRKYCTLNTLTMNNNFNIVRAIRLCCFKNDTILSSMKYLHLLRNVSPYPFYRNHSAYYTIVKIKWKCIVITNKFDCPNLLHDLDYEYSDRDKKISILFPIEIMSIDRELYDFKKFDLSIITYDWDDYVYHYDYF